MHENFSPSEYKLYGRQMILPELGLEGQKKLKNSHAVVIGAGGLGAPVLLYLAGAGVGTITIIDDDAVEVSNLHRQVIHTFSRVENSKAQSAADSLRSLNPFITVRTVEKRLTEENVDVLFAGASVVLDGSDNFETRYIASRACARAGIAHIWAAILGFDAQMSVFWQGHGPVYEDLYPVQPAPGTVPTCSTAGVIGALAGVVGTSMAMEALKILAEIGTPLIGQVGYYSGLEGRWEYIPLLTQNEEAQEPHSDKSEQGKGKKEPNLINRHNSASSPQKGGNFPLDELSWEEFEREKNTEKAFLIDVRERAEYLALTVPGSTNLPFGQLQKMEQEGTLTAYISAHFGGETALFGFFCSGGPRSSAAAEIFRNHGAERAFNIAGGLAQWLNQKI